MRLYYDSSPAVPISIMYDMRILWCRQDLNQSVTSLLQELDIPRAISCPPHLDNRWGNPLVRIDVNIVYGNREDFNIGILVNYFDINS